MRHYKKIIRLCLIALVGFGFTLVGLGCQGETKGRPEPVVTKKIVTVAGTQSMDPAKTNAATNNAQPSASAALPKQAEKPVRLPYDPAGKLDPFRPVFKEEPQLKADLNQKPKMPELMISQAFGQEIPASHFK